jgi:hypothetical protein
MSLADHLLVRSFTALSSFAALAAIGCVDPSSSSRHDDQGSLGEKADSPTGRRSGQVLTLFELPRIPELVALRIATTDGASWTQVADTGPTREPRRDGTSWTQLAIAGPSPRSNAVMTLR